MDIDKAAVFLVGTILTSMAFIIIVVTAVAINNIIHKYWKSWGWKFFPAFIYNDEEQKENLRQEPKR